MLQIRLKPVPTPEGGGGAKPSQVETVTVACPDHLVLADLPVAKSLGSATATSLVKTVGRRSRRQLGERVHFCVRCDFPIAIYGRLSPCEHAFCLDCARSDSICYLCDERIQKIQTIKLMEGIFICAAPHCLKSFLKRTEFESHVHQTHADIVGLNTKKDGTEPEAVSAKKPTSSDSTIQAPPRPVLSPSSNSQINDREDKAHRMQPHLRPIIQPKSTPSGFGQIQNHLSEPPPDNNQPPQGFDRPSPQNRFSQQSFDTEVVDKQHGNVSETPYPEYPMHPHQPPNFAVPVNSNYVLAPPPFSYPPFANDGAQPFYGAPFEMTRQDSAPEVGPEQGSLLGFPPGGVNFSENYPRPWNLGPESSPQFQDFADGFRNMSDSQGRMAFFQGGILPSNVPLPPPADKGMEAVRGGNAMDIGDYKGILAPQPSPLPPPPPPHSGHHKRGKFYSADMGRDGHRFGWQHEKHDSFESGQD